MGRWTNARTKMPRGSVLSYFNEALLLIELLEIRARPLRLFRCTLHRVRHDPARVRYAAQNAQSLRLKSRDRREKALGPVVDPATNCRDLACFLDLRGPQVDWSIFQIFSPGHTPWPATPPCGPQNDRATPQPKRAGAKAQGGGSRAGTRPRTVSHPEGRWLSRPAWLARGDTGTFVTLGLIARCLAVTHEPNP